MDTTLYLRHGRAQQLLPSDWQEKVYNGCCYPLALANGKVVSISADLNFFAHEKLGLCKRIVYNIFVCTIWLLPTAIGLIASRYSLSYQKAKKFEFLYHYFPSNGKTIISREKPAAKADEVVRKDIYIKNGWNILKTDLWDKIQDFDKTSLLLAFKDLQNPGLMRDLGRLCPTIKKYRFIREVFKEHPFCLVEFQANLARCLPEISFVDELTDEELRSLMVLMPHDVASSFYSEPQAIIHLAKTRGPMVKEAITDHFAYNMKVHVLNQYLQLPPEDLEVFFDLYPSGRCFQRAEASVVSRILPLACKNRPCCSDKMTMMDFYTDLYFEAEKWFESTDDESLQRNIVDAFILPCKEPTGELLFRILTFIRKPIFSFVVPRLTEAQWESLETHIRTINNYEKVHHWLHQNISLIKDKSIRKKLIDVVFINLPIKTLYEFQCDFPRYAFHNPLLEANDYMDDVCRSIILTRGLEIVTFPGFSPLPDCGHRPRFDEPYPNLHWINWSIMFLVSLKHNDLRAMSREDRNEFLKTIPADLRMGLVWTFMTGILRSSFELIGYLHECATKDELEIMSSWCIDPLWRGSLWEDPLVALFNKVHDSDRMYKEYEARIRPVLADRALFHRVMQRAVSSS